MSEKPDEAKQAVRLPSGPDARSNLCDRATNVAANAYAFYLSYMGLGVDPETNSEIARQLILQTGTRVRKAASRLGL